MRYRTGVESSGEVLMNRATRLLVTAGLMSVITPAILSENSQCAAPNASVVRCSRTPTHSVVRIAEAAASPAAAAVRAGPALRSPGGSGDGPFQRAASSRGTRHSFRGTKVNLDTGIHRQCATTERKAGDACSSPSCQFGFSTCPRTLRTG